MNKTEWKEHCGEERMQAKLRKWYGHFIGFQQQSNMCYTTRLAEHADFEEGNGRFHHAGGSACDYCSHCNGSAGWCPLMD